MFSSNRKAIELMNKPLEIPPFVGNVTHNVCRKCINHYQYLKIYSLLSH